MNDPASDPTSASEHRAASGPAANDLNDGMTAVFNEVRLLNNRLIELVGALHRTTGISASQRAVLEFVRRDGPATVPTIARARGVTRQHIQTITNELRSLALVELQDNPAHQRSPMVALTEHGSDTIDAILERERMYLGRHVGGLDGSKIRDAAETLAQIRHSLGDDAS